MSQDLTLKLSDDLYAAIVRAAQDAAQAPDEWVLEHLPELLPAEPEMAAEDMPFELEWQQYLRETALLRASPPPSLAEASRLNQALFRRLCPQPLADDDALELAMAEDLAEWNLEGDE